MVSMVIMTWTFLAVASMVVTRWIVAFWPSVYSSEVPYYFHSTKKPVTTMLSYPWKCTVLHCNHLGNTWKPLVLMTRHFNYCPSASEGDNQSVRSSNRGSSCQSKSTGNLSRYILYKSLGLPVSL